LWSETLWSVDGTRIEKARFIGTWPKGVEPVLMMGLA